MKPREVNEGRHGTWQFPDNIADWDAPSDWERKRLASMESLLNPGMVLYDIGTEFGWLSAIYGSWCGHENMVLVEPGDSFWVSIRKIWHHNHLKDPIACFKGFAGRESTPFGDIMPLAETAYLDGPEQPAMAYGTLGRDTEIPVITIDDICRLTDRPPGAITIDIEGAEMEALLGAAEVLHEYRPIVWVSIHDDLMEAFGSDGGSLINWFMNRGYFYVDLGTDHEHHALFLP